MIEKVIEDEEELNEKMLKPLESLDYTGLIRIASEYSEAVIRPKKELSKTTKKLDAVRRCNKGYECDFIAKEKLKQMYLEDVVGNGKDNLNKKVVSEIRSNSGQKMTTFK